MKKTTKVCVMRSTFVGFIAGCLFGVWSFAVNALENTDILTSDHPDTYIVKEGDTLWEIAGKFLNNPWHWSALWHPSSGIENPNLIYPGDIIVLSMEGDKPHLSLRRSNQVVKRTQSGENVVKLSPRVRVLPPAKAIPTIPYNIIGPFLSKSKVMPEGVLEHAPKIIAVDEEHLLVSEGNRFYTKRLPNSVGETLSVFRPGKILKHPKTGIVLGEETIYLGNAVVEKHAETTSLIVRKSIQEIYPGDKLCPVDEDRIEPYFFPKLPEGRAQGYIVSVLGGINQISQNQVVIISGGLDQGRTEGDVLNIYQRKEDLPTRVKKNEKFEGQLDKSHKDMFQFESIWVGRLIVFNVFSKTSMGLVMDATRAIYLHDEVDSP